MDCVFSGDYAGKGGLSDSSEAFDANDSWGRAIGQSASQGD
jgi:hypothetical protein